MFLARDMGHPVPFEKPFWAYTYTEEQLRLRDHEDVTSGYWWVGFLPGKRESRRFLGDYVLTEKDCLENTDFEDAVAYGGRGGSGYGSEEKSFAATSTCPYQGAAAGTVKG